MNVLQEKKQIREQMRDLRRSLLEAEKISGSKRICDFLIADLVGRKKGKLFAYLALREEPNLEAALEMAQQLGWEVAVPALCSETEMVAAKLSEKRTKTSLGFEEPDVVEIVPPEEFDLLWIPGTAFDSLGFRLGMGGGFYDRCFAQLHQRNHLTTPQRIGLAHACQQVEQLPVASWDVPLHAVVTDLGWSVVAN